MATKAELKKRWERDGGVLLSRLQELLLKWSDVHELRVLLRHLPFAEEVESGLDFRGVKFARDVRFRDLDLSGARFDDADLTSCAFLGVTAEGAVFNGVNGNRVTFRQAFPRASFVNASLRAARFVTTDLRGADFSKAGLQSATLAAANCGGATFRNAKLKSASLGKADLTGADLSGANLAEAALGEVRFDAATRIDGADFGGASMDQDLKEFVAAAGISTAAGENVFELALFDSTVDGLKRRNRDHSLDHLIGKMSALRGELLKNPQFDWNGALEAELTEKELAVVLEAFEEAGNHVEDYI